MRNEERLIVALDVCELGEAAGIVETLRPDVKIFKIGGALFTASGSDAVRMVHEKGCDVFLDLKLHDIPSTVEKVSREIARLNVKMFSLHSSGGSEMVKAAVRGASKGGVNRPLSLAVTVLTHLEDCALSRELGVSRPLNEHVASLARLSVSAGADGIICSPLEISFLREMFGGRVVMVTPGIRPESSLRNDQHRTLTPRQAITAGADYIVVGRPILESPDIRKAAADIIGELKSLPNGKRA